MPPLLRGKHLRCFALAYSRLSSFEMAAKDRKNRPVAAVDSVVTTVVREN